MAAAAASVWKAASPLLHPSRTHFRTLPLLLVMGLFGQVPGPVSRVEIRTEPADARVRPLESIVVHVSALGASSTDRTGAASLPLKRGPATFHLRDARSGWLSKPFRRQGLSGLRAPLRSGSESERRLAAMAARHSGLQDTVLFTAPDRTGEVVLTATIEGVSATVRITVTDDAMSQAIPERVKFGPQPATRDPYRALAEHYAPFVAQETWFQPKSDYLARFDADGDWRGDNNWENLAHASSQAYVYYAAIATETHWFLIYNFFHLRDYSDKCAAGTCHENDNEGLVLTIARDGTHMGSPVAMETLAHNKVYSYRADPRVRGNAHNLDGNVEFSEGSHPVVFVHSGGHGVYGTGQHSGYSAAKDEFTGGTGVTYVYKGFAERPRYPSDRNVGYDLLSIHDHWWVRSQEARSRSGGAFAAYYRYEPAGGRPPAAAEWIAGAFRGMRHGKNMAKPFWGWHDNETRKKGILATGQWGLDPAYAVSRNLALPGPVSLRYTFNPYLGVAD